MPAGRPPTPSALRKLSGSHPERLNRREARFRKVESVTPPKRVAADPEALEEFNRVLPELIENGLLTRANLMIFAMYCQAVALWQRASEDLAARGSVLVEEIFDRHGEITGHKEKPNPAHGQIIEYAKMALRHASEFGMTPSAATRVQADPPEDKAASFDDFLAAPEEVTKTDGDNKPN